ncbi:MAG TPA: hypothetical protein VGW33_04470 [Terriglobia bacterium]|nr:hypothetical protein [Terriglobia bacterium]
MRKDFSTEQFGHFVKELQESFWGDFQGQARRVLEAVLKAGSEQQREQYLG